MRSLGALNGHTFIEYLWNSWRAIYGHISVELLWAGGTAGHSFVEYLGDSLGAPLGKVTRGKGFKSILLIRRTQYSTCKQLSS